MASSSRPAFSHGEDPLVHCPYNPSHLVKSRRIDIHISRCQRDNRRVFLNCPFNRNHEVAADALYQHLATCPDKPAACGNSEEASTAAVDDPYPIRPSRVLPEPDECWDADNASAEDRPMPSKEPFFPPLHPGMGVRSRRRQVHPKLTAAPRPDPPFQVRPESPGKYTCAPDPDSPPELPVPPQPTTTLRPLQPEQLFAAELTAASPGPSGYRPPQMHLRTPVGTGDAEEELLARRLAALGRGRAKKSSTPKDSPF